MPSVVPAGYSLVPLTGLTKTSDNSGPYILDSSGNPILFGTTSGSVAAAAADSGNPVKVGGVYNAVLPTYTTGQRTDLQVGSKGQVLAALVDANGSAMTGAPTADGIATSAQGMSVNATVRLLNGTTLDRKRNNQSAVELASAARTTTQTGADRTNHNSRALHVVVDVTVAGTGSITPKIQGKDANGIYYDLLVGTAIIANGTTVLKIGPGITAAANAAASDFVPRTFRIVVTADNANPVTYSVGYELSGC
jgi:hypothetical protein